MNILFKEKQKFNLWWLWILLIGITLIPVYGIYKQIFNGEQFGNNPLSDSGLILFLVFMILFLLFFWMMKLTTEINKESIKVKFFPFTHKTILWKDVKTAEIINYGFVGGWGIRLGTKHGTVYNVKGNIGLAIELKNGEKICIGTQKEDELNRIVKEAIKQ